MARGARVRMIQVEVEVSGSHLATYVADAVVVATPDRLDRLLVQRRRLDPGPAAAEHDHHPGGRLPDARCTAWWPARSTSSTMSLRSAPHGAVVSIDGQWDLPMAAGDRVEVRALEVPLRLIEPPGTTPFYDLLRTKAVAAAVLSRS